MDGEWKRGWSEKEKLERHRSKKRQRFFFFCAVWFSIRGTRADKTKRTVTQRNNPSSVPSCSCCSSLPPPSLSLQFPQIPAEIESLFTGTVCWHHPLHTECPALSPPRLTLLWQWQTRTHHNFLLFCAQWLPINHPQYWWSVLHFSYLFCHCWLIWTWPILHWTKKSWFNV